MRRGRGVLIAAVLVAMTVTVTVRARRAQAQTTIREVEKVRHHYHVYLSELESELKRHIAGSPQYYAVYHPSGGRYTREDFAGFTPTYVITGDIVLEAICEAGEPGALAQYGFIITGIGGAMQVTFDGPLRVEIDRKAFPLPTGPSGKSFPPKLLEHWACSTCRIDYTINAKITETTKSGLSYLADKGLDGSIKKAAEKAIEKVLKRAATVLGGAAAGGAVSGAPGAVVGAGLAVLAPDLVDAIIESLKEWLAAAPIDFKPMKGTLVEGPNAMSASAVKTKSAKFEYVEYYFGKGSKVWSDGSFSDYASYSTNLLLKHEADEARCSEPVPPATPAPLAPQGAWTEERHKVKMVVRTMGPGVEVSVDRGLGELPYPDVGASLSLEDKGDQEIVVHEGVCEPPLRAPVMTPIVVAVRCGGSTELRTYSEADGFGYLSGSAIDAECPVEITMVREVEGCEPRPLALTVGADSDSPAELVIAGCGEKLGATCGMVGMLARELIDLLGAPPPDLGGMIDALNEALEANEAAKVEALVLEADGMLLSRW